MKRGRYPGVKRGAEKEENVSNSVKQRQYIEEVYQGWGGVKVNLQGTLRSLAVSASPCRRHIWRWIWRKKYRPFLGKRNDEIAKKKGRRGEGKGLARSQIFVQLVE